MSQQRVVSIGSGQEAQQHETEAVLYNYVFGRASRDETLDQEASKNFEQAHQMTPVQESSSSRAATAANVGRRLAEIGDEIDAEYQEQIKEIVQMAGSPESAFSMFSEIVKHLFEWDEPGGARISIGRIASLLNYCYHLVRTYITQNVPHRSLIAFLGMVGMWLFKFLVKAKFYEWLDRQGGWGGLLTSLVPIQEWGRNAFLVVGIASLAIWAYSYFRGR